MIVWSFAGLSPLKVQEPTMDTEIQLISDGDGLAIIGDPAVVERFLVSEGLQSQAKDLGLHRLSPALFRAAGAARAAGTIAEGSGRWVQLTGPSVQLINKTGNHMMTNSATGLNMGVVQGAGGQIQGIVQFATQSPLSLLANPAILAGAAGMMAQFAMQQAMDEISEYLAIIDEKVDDVLRAQKDAVFADMIGVDLVIEEAMTVRGQVGRVSEVTWSKVQGTSMAIARTQAYVLRQLDALAEKLERKTDIPDLANTTNDARATVQEWLAVLARCFQLQDALAILELDRVMDMAPEELHEHRVGLKAARQHRLELIARSTQRLMVRMDTASSRANNKVLFHPIASRNVVDSSNQVASGLVEFNGRIGIEGIRDSVEARRWTAAAIEARDKAFETGAEGVNAAGRVGNEALVRARSGAGKFSSGIAERARRLSGGDQEDSPKVDPEG
jgi:hypothetical protein